MSTIDYKSIVPVVTLHTNYVLPISSVTMGTVIITNFIT